MTDAETDAGSAGLADADGGDGRGDAATGTGGDAAAGAGSDAATGAGSDGPTPLLSRPAAADLLWGVVGGLTFLVLVQGYELLADAGVPLAVKFGVALLVGAVTAGLTRVVRERVSGAPS